MSKPDLNIDPDLATACSAIVSEIRRQLRSREGTRPVVVALDGGSGSGKSTLTALVAAEVDAVIVPGDDFFAAQITDAEWDLLDAEGRARAAIDWRRLRREALEPLIAGRNASWHPFDFAAGTRTDGSYPMSAEITVRQTASVIVLDGAYSCRPELADLIDVAVLVDVPAPERRRRLASRDEKAFSDAWHARWDAAEDYYFTRIRPAPRSTWWLKSTLRLRGAVRLGRRGSHPDREATLQAVQLGSGSSVSTTVDKSGGRR